MGRLEITGGATLAKSAFATRIGASSATLNGEAAIVARSPAKILEIERVDAIQDVPSFAKVPLPSAGTAGWGGLSIFSGCGGLDLGFLQEGIFAQAAYDIDRTALSTYVTNLPHVAVRADLETHSPALGNNRVLLAGAPCQGFSTAGKRKVEDPRNALLMRVADIALAQKSQVVVVENVPAAISGMHRKLWEAFEDRLRLAGFNVRRILLEGLSCGLGQRRKRLFLLCWRGSDCINVRIRDRPSLTVREVLHGVGLPNDNEILFPKPGERDWLIARRVPAGHKISNVRVSERAVATWEIPEVYGATTQSERDLLSAVTRLRRRDRVRSFGDGDPVHIERLAREIGRPVDRPVERLVKAGYLREIGECVDLRQTYNGRYRRLEWDTPSPTVDTRFGRIDLFLHPEEHRAMTPQETARIQGFPDAFRFLGTRKEKFIQLGNAVPPPMAAALAEYVREAILKA